MFNPPEIIECKSVKFCRCFPIINRQLLQDETFLNSEKSERSASSSSTQYTYHTFLFAQNCTKIIC